MVKPEPSTILLDLVVEQLCSSSKRVYSPHELDFLVARLRTEHGFPKSLSEKKLQESILEKGALREIDLSATYPLRLKRYQCGDFSMYELALSLKPGSYLSHGTAAHFHNIIGEEPATVYVNKEQSPKKLKGKLTQAAINRAFSRQQRTSGYVVTHDYKHIMILTGKHSGRLGVISWPGPKGEQLEITDLERTLIDIAVRPAYAGGAKSVAEAYCRALPKISLTRLANTLADLKHIYPYHQAIGFYLQYAGHPTEPLKILREHGLKFDFFLEHGMKTPRFNRSWRVYCPSDL